MVKRLALLAGVVVAVGLALPATSFAAADIFVTKTETPDPVVAGENVTYSITISNAGPDAATNVGFADPIPSGTTFVSLTQNSGPAFMTTTPPVGGTGTAAGSTGSMANGATATFTLVVRVNSNVPQGGTLTNTVSISSGSDSTPANNSDTETTAVVARADLSMSSSDSPEPVLRGGNITYTLRVRNDGPSDAQNVSLSNAIPSGTTLRVVHGARRLDQHHAGAWRHRHGVGHAADPRGRV
jgi:uncharacterized repeat protein (TIGR01451 family)